MLFGIPYVVAVVNMKIAIETKFWSAWTIFSYSFSFGLMFILSSLYSETNLSMTFGDSGQDFRHVYFTLLSKLSFWLVIVAAVLMSLIPDILVLVCNNSSFRLGKIFNFSKAKANKHPRGRSILNLSYIGNLQAPRIIDLRQISAEAETQTSNVIAENGLQPGPGTWREHCKRNGIYPFSSLRCSHEDHPGWLSPVQLYSLTYQEKILREAFIFRACCCP
ncbi:unnamed protein product [Allacma fusca]|uniref:P-type ATPase C-terminal domain-containing protein n=1 Tax=Allacma fusca TaxID=39272 RepID=A0A8J2JHC3_9HEXA|nr:unnamed protein product [Allacma fusca]